MIDVSLTPPPSCAGPHQHHSNQCQWSLLACQAASVGCVHTPFRPVLGCRGIEQSLFAFIINTVYHTALNFCACVVIVGAHAQKIWGRGSAGGGTA